MNKTQPIDLDAFAGLLASQEEGMSVQIRGPDGSDLGLTIVVAGPDSDRQKKARQRQIDRRLEAQNAAPQTAESIDADNHEIAAESTISWSALILFGGPLECTAANAGRLYRAMPFIYDQILMAAASRKGFLKH
jgi:hypothetical protein